MTTINVFDGSGQPGDWTFNEVERRSLDRFQVFISRAAQVWEDTSMRPLWGKLVTTVRDCTQAKNAPADLLMTMRAMLEAIEMLVVNENVQFHGDCSALLTATCMRLRYLGSDEEAYGMHLRAMVSELLPAANKVTGTIIISCHEVTRTYLSTNHEQVTLDTVRRDHYREMAARNINAMPWALHSVILYQGKTESLYTFEDVEISRVTFMEQEESLRIVMKYRSGHAQDRLLGRDGPNGGKLPKAKPNVTTPGIEPPWPDTERAPDIEPMPWTSGPGQPAQWPTPELDDGTKEAIRRLIEVSPKWFAEKKKGLLSSAPMPQMTEDYHNAMKDIMRLGGNG